MSTLKVDIINPKAAKLLKDLEDMNLISIRKSTKSRFVEILEKLRRQSESAPSFEEITKEVEIVRSKRYGGK